MSNPGHETSWASFWGWVRLNPNSRGLNYILKKQKELGCSMNFRKFWGCYHTVPSCNKSVWPVGYPSCNNHQTILLKLNLYILIYKNIQQPSRVTSTCNFSHCIFFSLLSIHSLFLSPARAEHRHIASLRNNRSCKDQTPDHLIIEVCS